MSAISEKRVSGEHSSSGARGARTNTRPAASEQVETQQPVEAQSAPATDATTTRTDSREHQDNRDNRNGGDRNNRDNRDNRNGGDRNNRDNRDNRNGGDRNNRDNRNFGNDRNGGNDGGRRRGRDRSRDRGPRREGGFNEAELEISPDDVLTPVAGILDVMDNYAFVRTSGYMPGPNDVYVSLSLVRRHGLRKGDAITGLVRHPGG